MRSAARDRYDANGRSAGFFQDACAFIHRRSGGENVVHENEMAARHAATVAHAEGIAQVLHSFLAIKPRLRGGVTHAPQGVQDALAVALRDELREHVGLIEFALAHPRRVEWHRHEIIEGVRKDALVVERLRQPFAERLAEVLAAVARRERSARGIPERVVMTILAVSR